MHTQLAQMGGVPDLGDPLFSMWRMGWVFHQLGGDPRPLFDANIFHPEPLTFTYSDSMLLPAAIGAPLLAIGPAARRSPTTCLFLSGFLLSGIATYVLIEGLLGSPRGGVRRRVALRVLSVPLRALQPSRAADDLLDAAGAAGAASLLADLAPCGMPSRSRCAAWRSSIRRCTTAFLPALRRRGPRRRCSSCPDRRGAASCAGRRGRALAVVLSVPLARPYYCGGSASRASATSHGHVLQRDARPTTCAPTRAVRCTAAGCSPTTTRSARCSLASRRWRYRPSPGAAPRRDSPGLRRRPGAAFDLSRGLNGGRTAISTMVSRSAGMRVPARISVILGDQPGRARRLRRAAADRPAAERAGPRDRLCGRWSRWSRSICIRRWSWYACGRSRRRSTAASPVTDGGAGGDTVQDQGSGDHRQHSYMYFSLWHWRPMINGYSGFTTPAYQPLLEDMADFPGSARPPRCAPMASPTSASTASSSAPAARRCSTCSTAARTSTQLQPAGGRGAPFGCSRSPPDGPIKVAFDGRWQMADGRCETTSLDLLCSDCHS